MPDPRKRAAAQLRGLRDDVESLKQAISTSEGVPNLVKTIIERATVEDTVSVSVDDVDRMVWDTDSWDDDTKQWD